MSGDSTCGSFGALGFSGGGAPAGKRGISERKVAGDRGIVAIMLGECGGTRLGGAALEEIAVASHCFASCNPCRGPIAAPHNLLRIRDKWETRRVAPARPGSIRRNETARKRVVARMSKRKRRGCPRRRRIKQRIPPKIRKSRLGEIIGPGLITGASDDDPSGIATYSQAGAQFGYGLGWTMLVSYPLMSAVQMISARIGRTTGHGIAGNLRRHIRAG